jgi:superfamily II DNA or RNA helicase
LELFRSGNIVNIRNRLWRIDAVYQNVLSVSSIDSVHNIKRKLFIPYENIEPSQPDYPDINRIGEFSQQDLFLSAHRLSLIHGSSPLLSLQRSSIIPTNFQLAPVIMALEAPRVRLLIADDVGLGKTIEAGLIINELIARQQAQRILIVCPANLREQWQEALLYQFKLDIPIISSLHRKYLEKELPVGASPWDYFNRLICSIDYAKTIATRNEIFSYDWDLVVIDEAHLCARPHLATGQKQSAMLRWQFLEKIATKTKHLLLLTATPHNGYSDSFASLLESLDSKLVSHAGIQREIARKHICQRTRKDVIQWLQQEENSFNPFPQSVKKEVEIDYLSPLAIKIYKSLSDYGRTLQQMVTFTDDKKYLAHFVTLHFLKRFLSSPLAIKLSLRNRINKLTAASDDEEIQSGEAKTVIVESDDLEAMNIDEAGRRMERTTFSEAATKYEIAMLEKIYEQAKNLTYQNDRKFQKVLTETLPELFRNAPKIILFTRYQDTLEYLREGLANNLKNITVLTISGQMSSAQRKEVLIQFEQAKKAILIATDCISEGMNLQYLCSKIIHYELPWNPNRMEQRNGRVDRFGQPESHVHIRIVIVKHSLDEFILKNIIEKSDRMKQDYGFAPPFFNDEKKIIELLLTSGMIPKTRKTASQEELTFFDEIEEEPIADVPPDEEWKEKMNQIQSESFYGQNQVSLPDIERKLRETEQSIGSEKEIRTFIESGLRLFGCQIESISDEVYNISISDNRLQFPGVDSTILQATFDKTKAAKNPAYHLIDLSHPLVNKLIQKIKQEAAKDSHFYGRTAYKGSNVISSTSAFMTFLVRFVVDTNPISMLEEFITIGFDLYGKEMLSADIIEAFYNTDSPSCYRTAAEVREDLQEVMQDSCWKLEVEQKIETRRQELKQERIHLLHRLGKIEEQSGWTKGIADVSFIRYELLTITIGYPL